MGDVYAEVRENRRKRRKYFLIFSVVIGVYLVALGASWLVFRSPFFRWKQFEITGNERVLTEDVMSLLRARALEGRWRPFQALLGLRSMLIWPDVLSEDDLAFLPTIKSITLEKNYGSRTIIARVEERKLYGIWCTDGDEAYPARCMWFDSEGTLFERAVAAQGGIIMTVRDHSQPFLPLRTRILPEAFVLNMFSIFRVLAASDLDRKEITINDLALEEVKVATYNGPELYFSLRFPADNSLAAIEDLMSKPGFGKLEYLDFRVESRVYYR
ncbi:MAG: hypothetical protein A2945_03665 [Candidatus Liptonbacteria bacterium RIFCSPLOWO2_01_FULL_52_25]|uniref:POTRA domain-containing protein n=1 Tax=Candidatus Liptonbacteria bacterium RIFCSPLOWO2_01_FULL_52_25 TaxID=1798650 RepID=A0A1G2CG88_9BACT|nr:MAG: hypothetical protein A2945_03665 [Candidatus Liptonbacteria bacterium RIFCSPLOWO2_01_FULL_52_25]